jgi:hypothetical protein
MGGRSGSVNPPPLSVSSSQRSPLPIFTKSPTSAHDYSPSKRSTTSRDLSEEDVEKMYIERKRKAYRDIEVHMMRRQKSEALISRSIQKLLKSQENMNY